MSTNLDNYYNPLPDCQIPGLAEIYDTYLGRPNHGVFVEIGAYDGTTHSNTCFLADLGWRGIYVEPVSEHWKLLRKNYLKYKNISCLQYAVSDYEGDAIIYVSGEMSTLDGDYITATQNTGYFSHIKINGQEKVTVTTLNTIINATDLNHIDLLVIDAEGSEPGIINGYSWNIKPTMIIIELHEKSEGWMKDTKQRESTGTITEYLEQVLNYKKAYADDINSIFVINGK